MSARRLFGFGSLALTAAAFATRAGQSLGYDELFTVWVSSRPLPDLIRQANLDGFTPPLFYALVKLVSLAGLSNEDLRLLPVVFAGLAACLGLRAAERLFGPASGGVALLLIPGSAYLFTFAHELRPYSALLACGFFCLGRLGGPASEKSDAQAALAALIATSLSYLGLSMVALWFLECRRRSARSFLLLVGLLAGLLCAPGLLKAWNLAASGVESRIAWLETGPALSSVFFGLVPVRFDPRIEALALIVLAALLVGAHDPKRLPTLVFPARAFVLLTLGVLALDAFVPIGFAPRYFALPMSALLLLMAGALTRFGRAGFVMAIAILGMNGLAALHYLTGRPSARADWRGAMGRIEERLGSGGVLLAFPFHHAAVAAHAYAPRLVMGGGYTSRTGPVFWYEPPASFGGYSFEGLKRIEDAGALFGRLAPASDVCVLTDEPDVRKTAALLGAFEALGGVEPFDTGDPRLRALCRSKGV